METINVLDDLLEKTKKNVNIENKKAAIDALETLFGESKDSKRLVEYLIKFPSSICQDFLEGFCVSKTDEQIVAVANAVIADEQFKKNINNIRCTKGFLFFCAFARKEKYPQAFLILSDILSKAKNPNDNDFPPKFINSVMKSIIVAKNNWQLIQDLYKQMTDQKIPAKEFEQRNLTNFKKIVENEPNFKENMESGSTASAPKKERRAPYRESDGSTKTPPVNNEPNQYAKIDETQQKILGMVRNILEPQQEILNYVRRAAENLTYIDTLTKALAQKDGELNSLREKISAKDRSIASLKSEVDDTKKRLSEAEVENADLNEELRKSHDRDAKSNNWDLIVLRKEISEDLKPYYDDFIAIKSRQYSENLVKIFSETLGAVFECLKLHGITYQ